MQIIPQKRGEMDNMQVTAAEESAQITEGTINENNEVGRNGNINYTNNNDSSYERIIREIVEEMRNSGGTFQDPPGSEDKGRSGTEKEPVEISDSESDGGMGEPGSAKPPESPDIPESPKHPDIPERVPLPQSPASPQNYEPETVGTKNRGLPDPSESQLPLSVLLQNLLPGNSYENMKERDKQKPLQQKEFVIDNIPILDTNAIMSLKSQLLLYTSKLRLSQEAIHKLSTDLQASKGEAALLKDSYEQYKKKMVSEVYLLGKEIANAKHELQNRDILIENLKSNYHEALREKEEINQRLLATRTKENEILNQVIYIQYIYTVYIYI